METPRIKFDGVSKRFRRGPTHDSLRDLIPTLLRRKSVATPATDADSTAHFWAVRDVSFTVEPGQCLGIIGGNGAGKSTTLKLLTKILSPTTGTATVVGRIGSLIEVSAGFHQDLTGRENTYLQGAIMGMSQELIRRQFDNIVDFAGIADFIDTPVKRYSSGMNARLGFSIAVHLEPDVLIVDEVLSVGDASFQERAFGKLKELIRGERPVVLVSHQLDRVVELATTAILLDHGRVRASGVPVEVVSQYLTSNTPVDKSPLEDLSAPVRVIGATLTPDTVIRAGDPSTLRLQVSSLVDDPTTRFGIGIDLLNVASGQKLFSSSVDGIVSWSAAIGRWEIEIPLVLSLPGGIYRIETFVWDRQESRMSSRGPTIMLRTETATQFAGLINAAPHGGHATRLE